MSEVDQRDVREWVGKLKQASSVIEHLQALQNLRMTAVRTRGAIRMRGTITQSSEGILPKSELNELLEKFRSEPVEIRREVAFALGDLAGEEIVPTLESLLDDPEDSVRRVTLESLGKIGGSRAVGILVKIASKHEDEEMRAKAVEVLGTLAVREWKSQTTSRAVPVRTRGLTARISVADLSPRAKEVIDQLKKLSKSDPSSHVRERAREATEPFHD